MSFAYMMTRIEIAKTRRRRGTQNRKIQQGRSAGALADAEETRKKNTVSDGAAYRLDHVAKTTITTILVTCVGCRIAIKTERPTVSRMLG